MSEETGTESAAVTQAGAAQALYTLENTLEKFLDTASVERVYAEPVQHGDTLIIPAAEVLTGLGFGVGYGSGSGGDEENVGEGSGGGGGGGGRTLSRPVAVIVASPEGVRVQEVVDPTKIALAALTATGFMFGMLMRMVKPKRALKDMGLE